MAGYAYGFDEGGPVEDDGAIPAPDNTGEEAAPQEEQTLPTTNEGGMAPARAVGSVINQSQNAMQDLEQPSQSGMQAPHQALRNTGKAILSYLMGADAADPQANKKFVAGVQAEHPDLSPDDANVVAVHKAFELGGPEAAWQMVQFNRMAYDAKQNFAFAALKGTQGKPPDVQAAAAAATQASQHVLDGSSAQFRATPDGFVTATVRGPTGQQTSMQMSPTDFARYLNVGADGQYDHVMENGGVPGTLQKISSAGAQGGKGAKPSQSMADTYDDDDTDNGNMSPIYRKGTANGSNFGKTPSTLDLSDGKDEVYQPKDDLESRANKRFPSASQYEQRNAWIAAQQDQAANARRGIRKSEAEGVVKRDVAAITGGSRVNSAEKRADGTVGAANVRADASREHTQAMRDTVTQRLNAQAEREGDINKRSDLRNSVALINGAGFAQLGTQQQQAILDRAGIPREQHQSFLDGLLGRSAAPQAPTPQAPTPQAPTPQAPAPQQQAPRQQPSSQGQGKLSPQDQQAINWANAHPGDPRAAKIKQLHGM